MQSETLLFLMLNFLLQSELFPTVESVQWGYLSTYSNNIASVVFPIAFNTTLRLAFTGDITESISTINSHAVGNVTPTAMEIRQAEKMDTDGTYWFAIGR